jgi:serine/threonine protein kinase
MAASDISFNITNADGAISTVIYNPGVKLEGGPVASTYVCMIGAEKNLIKRVNSYRQDNIDDIARQFNVETELVGNLSTCRDPAVGIACFKGVIIGKGNIHYDLLQMTYPAKKSFLYSYEGRDIFFLYEFINGQDLLENIENPDLDYPKRVQIMLELFNIIKTLHTNGFVHLDIKPENIMLRDGNHPVLIDFEFSCKVAACQQLRRGTPMYVAPEMSNGSRIENFGAVDIYAAGMTLFYFLIRRPFGDYLTGYSTITGESYIERRMARYHARGDDIKALYTTGVDPVILKLFVSLIAGDPTKRPTAADAVAYLSTIVSKEPVAAPAVAPAKEIVAAGGAGAGGSVVGGARKRKSRRASVGKRSKNRSRRFKRMYK